MTSLWPDIITDVPPAKTPATLLKEQGVALSQKTNNLVEGRVARIKPRNLNDFRYAFILSAPTLNYSYRLFDITHGITLYPTTVLADHEIYLDLKEGSPDNGVKLASQIMDPDQNLYADSEADFVHLLTLIFKNAKTIGIIRAILAMANGAEGSIQ